MKIEFTLNGEATALDADPGMPLLWALRDDLGLMGTKFGCGVGLCGACTVHFNGVALRSCSLAVGAVAGAVVTTIEGLGSPQREALTEAWLEEEVPQCGYCQTGQIMAAAAMLSRHPEPDDAVIDKQMTNLCRCGTYNRIRRAIHRAASALNAPGGVKEAGETP